ncbi:MAG: cell division protein FtsZ [Firmicutes bacterium]|nr:cell division protein FtsZ [Bacillota bacterium]
MGAKIKVVGIGGGGNNAINRMIDVIQGVEFIAVNTDVQDLGESKADIKLAIGDKTTKGLGSGGDPRTGQNSAEESKDMIREALKGADLVFITAGMGGGTGTGASPIVAMVARELGIMCVGVVTKPFAFEGRHRMRNAEIGISNLSKFVDCNIVIPNQKLVDITKTNTTVVQAFKIADSVLIDGVRCITDLIMKNMTINIDFADIASIMRNSGLAHMGIGRASGEGRLLKAIQQAISSPILETSIKNASQVIMSVTGGSDLTLQEVHTYGTLVKDVLDENCNIIFGADLDKKHDNEVQIIIIATGFPDSRMTQQVPIQPPKNVPTQAAPAAVSAAPTTQRQTVMATIQKPTVPTPKIPVETIHDPDNRPDDSGLPLYIRKLRDSNRPT